MNNENENNTPFARRFVQDMKAGTGNLLFTAFGFPPKYTFEQLCEIEEAFKERFGNRGVMPTTAITFGFYLGETMVREIPGAEWSNLDQDDIWDIRVSVPTKASDKMECMPVRRFNKYSKNTEDRPSTMFWMFAMLSKYTHEELLGMGTPMEDGWYIFPGGHMMRLSVPKDKAAVEESFKKPEVDQKLFDLEAEELNVVTIENGKIKETPMGSMDTIEKRERDRLEKEKENSEKKEKKDVRGKDNYKF